MSASVDAFGTHDNIIVSSFPRFGHHIKSYFYRTFKGIPTADTNYQLFA